MSKLQSWSQSRKVVNITHAGIRQESYYPGSPIALPTSEPVTAQISFTLNDADFPSSPDGMLGQMCKFLFWGIIGGQNNATSSRTVSYRLIKNGVNINSATRSVGTTTPLYTLAPSLVDCVQGDIIEVKLWCTTGTGVDNTYAAFFVQPTRFGSNLKVGQLVTDIKTTYSDASIIAYTPILGVSLSIANGYYPTYDAGTNLGGSQHTPFGAEVKVAAISGVSGISYGFCRANAGDIQAPSHNTSATLMPMVGNITRNVTKVEYRPTSIVL